MARGFSKVWLIAILAVVLAGGFFAWQHFGASKEFPAVETGIIEGSLGYPSEGIPEEMKICAENIATKKQYCTEDHIQDNKYTYKLGYKIEAPVGDYFVFATLPSWKDYKSYYSEFVTCGLNVRCPSHEPIAVAVKANSITANIDPKDWYKPLDETANWTILRDNQFGFEMKYPAEFFQGYAQHLWPKITSMPCDVANFSNKCPVVPLEGFVGNIEDAIRQGFIKSERMSIGGTPYCLQTNAEGAMGTSYATYKYLTPKDGKCVVVSFTVSYSNCQSYLPIENPDMQKKYDACKLGNEVASPATIQKILSTFNFLE